MLRPSLPRLETRYVLVVPAYGEFGTVDLSQPFHLPIRF
jgi:hypothetical protein